MLIKYMGTSDIYALYPGEDFGGQLGTPLSQQVVWDWHNNHVVDTSKVGLSDDAAALLLKSDDFKDVTGLETVPLGQAQILWKQMRDEPANGDLPPGYTKIGDLPTSQGQVIPSSVDESTAEEAAAFSAAVNDTAPDPVVTPTSARTPTVKVPTSTGSGDTSS